MLFLKDINNYLKHLSYFSGKHKGCKSIAAFQYRYDFWHVIQMIYDIFVSL